MISTALMALEKDVFRGRVIAGLALRGLELRDLPALVEGTGLGKHEVQRIGRPSDESLPTTAAVLTLSDLLGLPREWFEEEDWRGLIPGSTEGSPEAVARAIARRASRQSREQSQSGQDATHQSQEGG